VRRDALVRGTCRAYMARYRPTEEAKSYRRLEVRGVPQLPLPKNAHANQRVAKQRGDKMAADSRVRRPTELLQIKIYASSKRLSYDVRSCLLQVASADSGGNASTLVWRVTFNKNYQDVKYIFGVTAFLCC